MKKQKKQFLIMLVFLSAFIIAFVILTIYNKKQERLEEQENKAISLIDADAEDVFAFSYYYDGILLEFRKEEGVWYYPTDKTVPLNQDSMKNMVDTMVGMEAVQELDDPAKLSEYGLAEPYNTITVMTEDKTYVVLLGKTNHITGQHYIKLEYSDTVYLADTDYDMIFQVSLDELTETEDGTESLQSTESLDDAGSENNTEALDNTEKVD